MNLQRINKGIRFWGIPGRPSVHAGVGTPQSVLASGPGSIFLQTDGADADHMVWYKTSAEGTKTGWQNSASFGVKKVAKIPLGTVATAGGVFSWQNPEAGSILITDFYLDVTTGVATLGLDAGTTTVSGTTAGTNIMSNVDVHVAGQFSVEPLILKLAAGKWVTGSDHGGGDTLTALVGNAYLEYLLI